jgi:hypothetical protein
LKQPGLAPGVNEAFEESLIGFLVCSISFVHSPRLRGP